MRANPGGQIDPSEVFGRDALIERLWKILDRQSVVLSAERRMGKTCIVKKMEAEFPPDKIVVYRELERVHTALEFAELVFLDVEGYLSRYQKAANRVRKFLADLSGSEWGGAVKFPPAFASHWKSLLVKVIEDLVEHKDHLVIFFWDEMPLMLYNIKQREGESTAMEVLDTLRSMRQMHNNLRMGFTGSIGLHNVIASLRRAKYANDPTNDMYTVDVGPLSPADAQNLAHCLFEGEAISADDITATTQAVAESVDYMPYYIHHVVDRIAGQRVEATRALAEDIVSRCLTDSHDPWHLSYYRERIDTYYEADECRFALNLLDILAATEKGLSFDELFNLLKSRLATEDDEAARDVLKLLQRDHYVEQKTDGSFCFHSRLIQRWWRINRGVTLNG